MVPLGAPVVPAAEDEVDVERLARSTAQDGVARARRAGLEAVAETRVGTGSSAVAARLLDVAEERDADLVVLGHRDLGTLEALLHASVSRAAVQDGPKPVSTASDDRVDYRRRVGVAPDVVPEVRPRERERPRPRAAVRRSRRRACGSRR